MGRPRKPKQIHEMSGAFEKHPERRKQYEGEPPQRGEIGEPPACFQRAESAESMAHQALWYELIAEFGTEVLHSARFRSWLEEACRLKLRSRRGTITAGERTALHNLLAKMGGSPADSSKVNILPQAVAHEAKNPFADLDEEDAGARAPN